MAALALAVLLAAGTARAEITETDILVAGRAIGFIETLPRGDVHVGIVYEPGNAQSAQQAHELVALMGPGLRVGNLVLTPSLLPLDQVGRAGVDLFFLAQGVGPDAEKVRAASRARKIPCITFDIAQVRKGTCTMGVRVRPKITVFVNRAAADASGTDLSAVFRMMITEI
jgi:hypothetical protein